MVLRNLKQALQISLVPALIGGAVVYALTYVFGISFDDLSNGTSALPEGVSPVSFLGFALCFLIAILATILWIIVSWHRFVLLEEYPTGFVPVFRSDRVLAYFGRLLMLILLGMLAAIPGIVVIGMLAQASVAIGIVAWIALIICLTVVFYRVSPILPSAAIGNPLKLSDAWQSTQGASGAIVVVVILSALFQMLLQILSALLLFIPVIGSLIVIFAFMLIVPLINVSILTTIYGVFVEKRALS